MARMLLSPVVRKCVSCVHHAVVKAIADNAKPEKARLSTPVSYYPRSLSNLGSKTSRVGDFLVLLMLSTLLTLGCTSRDVKSQDEILT